MSRLVGVAAVVVAIGIGVGGCGDDSDSSGTGGSDGSDYLAQVQSDVDTLLGKGSFAAPPTSAPEHEPGKTIAIVSTKVLSAGEANVEAQESAAEALGWNTVFYETEADPATAGPAIRSAIARGVDAITLNVIDCQYVAGPLREAIKADIPVVAVEGYDCDETDSGADPLFTATVQFNVGDGSQADFYDALYTAMAQYPIAKLDGEANTIYSVDNAYQASIQSVKTFEAVYDACVGCELTVDAFPVDQFGKLQARTQQLLLQNPNANAVVGSYADIVLGGVEAAVRSSGKDVLLSAGDSQNPAARELVASGRADYGYGFPAGWGGYAQIDTLIRLFAGEEAVNSGWGVNLYDADHNLDSNGEYEVPYDFASLYLEAWGVD